jgi:hypothetical protein
LVALGVDFLEDDNLQIESVRYSRGELIKLHVGAVRAWHIVEGRAFTPKEFNIIAGDLDAFSVFTNAWCRLGHGD